MEAVVIAGHAFRDVQAVVVDPDQVAIPLDQPPELVRVPADEYTERRVQRRIGCVPFPQCLGVRVLAHAFGVEAVLEREADRVWRRVGVGQVAAHLVLRRDELSRQRSQVQRDQDEQRANRQLVPPEPQRHELPLVQLVEGQFALRPSSG